jgi:hypothetical protein
MFIDRFRYQATKAAFRAGSPLEKAPIGAGQRKKIHFDFPPGEEAAWCSS